MTEEYDSRYEQLDQIIREYKDKEGTLITILHQAQKIFGYLPREVQIYIAEHLGIPFPEVYGVVSFYSLFSMEPRGKYTIEVCMGTACYVKGIQQILDVLKEELNIDPGETTEDGMFTIETTRCLGACSLAPVMAIGKDMHGHLTPEKVREILKTYQ
ncbi:MAG: NADH-quinone oxidoreductase subunit NuoE [Halanaerobiales bacterium]|nr:NADH-quinone oxidoreductase subunit NuoE [Halanaerobiales bacterium]